MKYYGVKFRIETPLDQLATARDLLSALAGDAGFETFEETEDGVTGYVQQSLFDRDALEQCLATFPLPQCTITYTANEAEDRDWNEQWEQEGFAPIIVTAESPSTDGSSPSSLISCLIHDGRHVSEELFDEHNGKARRGDENEKISIEIDARMAFGTGTHETTRMMVSSLLSLPLSGRRVLDCGTGTGILAIAALKRGATEAVGYDIDEWSVDNARHNAVINCVEQHFTLLLGDASVLEQVEGLFDIVVANINRNILLADMPAFAKKMAPKGCLVISGFYSADIHILIEKAATLGLEPTGQNNDGEWACIILQKKD